MEQAGSGGCEFHDNLVSSGYNLFAQIRSISFRAQVTILRNSNLREFGASAQRCRFRQITCGCPFINFDVVVLALCVVGHVIAVARLPTDDHLPVGSVESDVIATGDVPRVGTRIVRRGYPALGLAVVQQHVTQTVWCVFTVT